MAGYLFRGGRFLDPNKTDLIDGMEVLVEGERIKEVSRKIKSSDATVIDLKGLTIMPGMIDCHVHVMLPEVEVRRIENYPPTMMAFKAAHLMQAMMSRGFTTLRDTGGCDFGIRDSVEAGLVAGPRLFIAGRTMTPTGGHGDARRRTDHKPFCLCCNGLSLLSAIVDGVPAVLHGVREEMRRGADFIKIMASGGVASPYDPLESVQFTRDEVAAIVEEVTNWGSYVAAHAYGADAIYRAVDIGIRTIEHGNLLDEKTAKLMAKKGAFLVPTLVAYDAIKRRAREYGFTDDNMAKNERVYQAGLRSIEIAKKAGVEIAFGSDLLGQLQNDHTREFQIRAQVLKPYEIIRSATLTAAKLLRREKDLGELKPGAYADLLVVEGNPMLATEMWQDGGPAISVIMKGGAFYRNRLH
ncbi:MAG: amidohydrolase family protein [Alphaproteobacteria bacterium]|nr:amidohydrolase family protein [Alphaproteobacteria bacterium]